MYKINEDAIGLFQLDNTTAETIYYVIKDALLRLGMQFENCCGRGYDAAIFFLGHITGVGKRFQEEFPCAIPVHCLSHCINLGLQEVAHKVKFIKEGLNLDMDMIQLIKWSPKRREIMLENVPRQQKPDHGLESNRCA